MKAVRRGRMWWTRAVVSPGRASTATQSPAVGRPSSAVAFMQRAGSLGVDLAVGRH